MENKKIKCSFKEHKEIEAINYCQECKVYLCNKCSIYHIGLLENHNLFNVEKNINEIFNIHCKEVKHKDELEFFCKNHNQLCCAACLSKIKNKDYGQHKDCDVYDLLEIKDEKKNKLIENIKLLEDLSHNIEKSINELKILFEKINENKELLKLKIQKIFTKIRTTLNEREDVLLLEIDKQFDKIYFNEDIIKESEKLPSRIKLSFEKAKVMDKEWNDNNKLKSIINDCINIENNIKDINRINDSIKKWNSYNNKKIKFIPEEDEINNFIEKIKIFGEIAYNKFIFKKCPININENRKYSVTGEKENILTKTGNDNSWMGTICEYELEKGKEHKWKIKILKSTKYKNIMVGVAPIDFDISSSNHSSCGWYFYCYNSGLYSGPPHKYSNKGTDLSKVKDEIIVVMNMNKGTLKFIIDNEDKGESYTDIPLDKPLSPAIILWNTNDSIEIIEC